MGDVMNNWLGCFLGIGAVILILIGCAALLEESSNKEFEKCIMENSEETCLIMNYKGL